MPIIPNINQRLGEYYLVRIWKRRQYGIPLYPYAVEETMRLKPPRVDIVNRHHGYIIAFLLRGTYRLQHDQQELTLQPNRVMIIPPGVLRQYKDGDGYHKFIFVLDGVLVREIFSSWGLNRYMTLEANIPEILKIHRNLFRNMSRQREEAMPEMIGNCMKLLALCAQSLPENNNGELSQVDRMRFRLEQECAHSALLATLAAEMKMPPATMRRIFQDKFGISPKQYQLNCRMRMALDLLGTTNKSIKEIAYLTGFQNQYYFSNALKHKFSRSPSELRRAMREETGEIILPPLKLS